MARPSVDSIGYSVGESASDSTLYRDDLVGDSSAKDPHRGLTLGGYNYFLLFAGLGAITVALVAVAYSSSIAG